MRLEQRSIYIQLIFSYLAIHTSIIWHISLSEQAYSLSLWLASQFATFCTQLLHQIQPQSSHRRLHLIICQTRTQNRWQSPWIPFGPTENLQKSVDRIQISVISTFFCFFFCFFCILATLFTLQPRFGSFEAKPPQSSLLASSPGPESPPSAFLMALRVKICNCNCNTPSRPQVLI